MATRKKIEPTEQITEKEQNIDLTNLPIEAIEELEEFEFEPVLSDETIAKFALLIIAKDAILAKAKDPTANCDDIYRSIHKEAKRFSKIGEMMRDEKS